MMTDGEAEARAAAMSPDERADTLLLAAAVFSNFARSDYFAPFADGTGSLMAEQGRAEARDTAGKIRYTSRIIRCRHAGDRS